MVICSTLKNSGIRKEVLVINQIDFVQMKEQAYIQLIPFSHDL